MLKLNYNLHNYKIHISYFSKEKLL
jgi:hypothetical protein